VYALSAISALFAISPLLSLEGMGRLLLLSDK
jgi:hypothetical protein